MSSSFGAILDTAIGLALLYLLLGLIASALQETLASALKWRGKQLRDGLTALLAGTGTGAQTKQLVDDLFGHPLVQGTSGNGLPSYLSARNFATVLFDVLTDGSHLPLFSQLESGIAGLPDGMPAKQSLTALVRQAGGDLDKLSTAVQSWYNDAMDRLSGDYKRWSHYFALGFGVLVAVVFNVDSINVTRTLWLDPQMRGAVAAVATQYVSNNAPPAGNPDQPPSAADLIRQAQAATQAVNALALPIGWPVSDKQNTLEVMRDAVFKSDCSGVWLVLGWIATGLAVSLGAPFWFDTLQKLINLRGAGPKPSTTLNASSDQGTGNA